MLSNFITYIQDQNLFRLSRDKILLAVSGGMDSIAMVQLFKKARVDFGIAHCNFQLRGAESDADAHFVQQLAQQLGVPFYSTCFETQQEANKSKKSIQIAARDLRYQWLEKIRQTQDYHYIGVAHHLNDSIETLLLNLTMGCGIRGLHGILPKNGFIIRPLLFSTRAEIQTYIEQQQFAYREDSSNANTKYTRNALRHLVVPPLQQINSNLEQTFQENFLRFRETEALYLYAIQQLKQEVCQEKQGQFWIDINSLSQSPAPLSLLYELLSPYHFKPNKIQYIYKRKDEESGAIYRSSSHQLLRDRSHWIVSPLIPPSQELAPIVAFSSPKGQLTRATIQLEWEILPSIDSFHTDSTTIYLDMNLIHFPLQLRHWQAGDLFYPLGMQGKKKKLSKFFKDIKMNRFEKEATWLLCDHHGAILWVVGHRADERFKVSPSTQKILKLNINIL